MSDNDEKEDGYKLLAFKLDAMQTLLSTDIKNCTTEIRGVAEEQRTLSGKVQTLITDVAKLQQSETSTRSEYERRFVATDLATKEVAMQNKETATLVTSLRSDVDKAKGSISLMQWIGGVGGGGGLVALLAGGNLQHPSQSQTYIEQHSPAPISGDANTDKP